MTDIFLETENQSGIAPRLEEAAQRFLRWLEPRGTKTHDPYDFWATRYGLWARSVYYRNRPLGAMLVAPVLGLDMLAPQLRNIFISKKDYPSSDAQLMLGYLNLYAVTKHLRYLDDAVKISETLLRSSIPGYSGYCWGYPFDWQSNRGLWKKGTPFITVTPYGFEAFLALFDAVNDEKYLSIARSAAEFAFSDLKDTRVSASASASSYSPHDSSQVVNASAYRAFVLLSAWERFREERFRESAMKYVNFILQSQKPDGSWLYAEANPQDAFIDHFHTCFVLKNLGKLNRILQSGDVSEALHRGYAYYRKNLFDEKGFPKPYAIRPRKELVRYEIYDFAEAIHLGSVLKDTIPEAYTRAVELARAVMEQFQLQDGHFVTRVYRGGLSQKMPYLRWPQAPMFYALTAILKDERGIYVRHRRNI